MLMLESAKVANSESPQSQAQFTTMDPQPEPTGFLSLPRELRDQIYELCLVVPEHERQAKSSIKRYSRQRKVALTVRDARRAWPLEHPPLLAALRQIREEGDEFYWGKNEWQVDLKVFEDQNDYIESEACVPMKQLRKWVDLIGMRRVKHLRDLTLRIKYCNEQQIYDVEDFRITLDAIKGLELHSPTFYHITEPAVESEIEWLLAVTEFRRKDNDGKGESIIEFFSFDEKIWSEWIAYACRRSVRHVLRGKRRSRRLRPEWILRHALTWPL